MQGLLTPRPEHLATPLDQNSNVTETSSSPSSLWTSVSLSVGEKEEGTRYSKIPSQPRQALILRMKLV